MENKKMVIIDLLNKISRNETVPKQIKYRNTIFIFDTTDNTYYDENNHDLFWRYNYKILNDTVEILPEENDEQYIKMQFPNTFKEFIKLYSFVDDKEIYTNGSELIPTFRLKQWVEHKKEENDEWKDINNIDVLQDILSTNKIEVLIENIGDVQTKINQLIKNQKYLKEKLDKYDREN